MLITNETKFCKDCKWSKVSLLEKLSKSYEYAKCYNPKIPKNKEHSIIALVTGKITKSGSIFCKTARKFESLCGEEGKHFEPKEDQKYAK